MSHTDRIDVARLAAVGAVAQVEHFASLGSTQDHAIQRVRAGDSPLPLLVVAEEQTAGRGRGANRWWTGRGSLAFSLAFDPAAWGLSGELAPIRSLAAGAAIVDTLAPYLPEERLGLHWPNDVFVAGRKIAGVLVDVLNARHHVVGIGLNVNNPLAAAPDDVRQRATSLCDLAGRVFDRTDILAALVLNLAAAMRTSASDPHTFGRRLNELCLQIGQPLVVDVAGRRTRGTCAGIAPDGALVLETPAGIERCYSGVLVHTH